MARYHEKKNTHTSSFTHDRQLEVKMMKLTTTTKSQLLRDLINEAYGKRQK